MIQDLRIDGHRPPVVLGFESFDDYPAHSPYFGAVAGRFANRIGGGKFTIDGKAFRGDANFLGKHLLHGGVKGIGKRVWTVAGRGPDFVTLTLRDADGEMGFPGNLDIGCTYRLKPDGILSCELAPSPTGRRSATSRFIPISTSTTAGPARRSTTFFRSMPETSCRWTRR